MSCYSEPSGMYFLPDGSGGFREVSLFEWGDWRESKELPFVEGGNRVGNWTDGTVRVSTVFLGINHNFGDGPPILFETMIFGGKHDQYQDRYATYAEAVAGHAAAVQMVEEGG